MPNFILFALAVSFGLLALDYYVYTNWRVFARWQPRLRWTLPFYRVLIWVMPLVLPLYAYASQWWEVEPRLVRFLVIGGWIVYYLPRVLIALALLLKDFARFVSWLFGWFQHKLLPDVHHQPAPAAAAAEAAPGGMPDPALDLTDMKRLGRRDFLQKMGWSVATVPFVVVGYGVFRTLYDFDVRRVTVPVAGLPRALDGLTIAQLSDLHAGSFFSPQPMHEAVALVNSLRPDVIAITGDFVNNDAAELPRILPALREMKADIGVYGSLGNHDHYARIPDVVQGIASTPIDLLVNAHRTLEIDGGAAAPYRDRQHRLQPALRRSAARAERPGGSPRRRGRPCAARPRPDVLGRPRTPRLRRDRPDIERPHARRTAWRGTRPAALESGPGGLPALGRVVPGDRRGRHAAPLREPRPGNGGAAASPGHPA